MSLRVPRQALASIAPCASRTTYARPDSVRGNAPPMNSLYVFRTPSRSPGPRRREGERGRGTRVKDGSRARARVAVGRRAVERRGTAIGQVAPSSRV